MLSIVTINFNNDKGLKKTINSVAKLKSIFSLPIELIVIDGGSSDGSKEVINDLKKYIDHLVIENDKGIYNAMNKGIKIASYEWLNFMNSGDVFENLNKIEKILKKNLSFDVIYGDKIHLGKTSKAGNISLLMNGTIHACHQSMFFKRSLKVMYSEEYKVYGDYDYVLKHYILRKNFKYVPLAFSNTEPDGIGQRYVWVKRIEKIKIILRLLGIKTLLKLIISKFKKIFKR